MRRTRTQECPSEYKETLLCFGSTLLCGSGTDCLEACGVFIFGKLQPECSPGQVGLGGLQIGLPTSNILQFCDFEIFDLILQSCYFPKQLLFFSTEM